MFPETTVTLRGVQITLPAGLPFSYTTEGTLILDCSAGFFGKIQLKPCFPEQAADVAVNKTRCGANSGAAQDKSLQYCNPSSNTLAAEPLSASISDTVREIPDTQATTSLLDQAHAPQQKDDCLVAGTKDEAKDAEEDNHRQESQPQHLVQDGPTVSGNSNAGLEQQTPRSCAQDHSQVQLQMPEGASGGPDLPAADATGNFDGTSEAAQKENTPAAANQPRSRGKRKSGSASGQQSAGKRSGKKLRGAGAESDLSLSFTWSMLEFESSDLVPQKRWGASFTAVDDNQVFLFAGNSTSEQLGDTWILDVAAGKWGSAKCPDVLGKAWHSAEVITSAEGQQLYAIGGERVPESAGQSDGSDEEAEGECLSDICQLDVNAKMWVQLPMSGQALDRSGHTTTLLPDGRILLFGGIDNSGRYCNDAHIIDLDLLNCFALTGSIIKGAPPKPRAYHSATLIGNHIVVLGGTGSRVWSFKEVYSLSLESWQWKEHTPDVGGEAPSPRSGHSAVALPGDRYLLVFGGGVPENDSFYGNIALLDTHTWTWSIPPVKGERPVGRSGHGMALVRLPGNRPALALYGGRARNETLCNDTWFLEIHG